MAHSHEEEVDENPTGFLNAVAVICFLLVGGGLWWAITTLPKIPDVSDESFSISPPDVDVDRLERQRAEQYGTGDLSKGEEEIAELMETVKKSNLLQFEEQGRKQAHDTQIQIVYHANEVITAVGQEGYMRAGEKMFDNCAKGFQELLDGLNAAKLEPARALRDPGEEYNLYREWCGNAYPAMERFNIVNSDGTWENPEVGPYVFDILNRFRWAAVLDLRKPPWKQLTPYEYEILTRWRASLKSVPKNKRVTWVIQAAEDLPQLEHHQLLGNLHYQTGDYDAALREYQEACKKNRQDAFLQKKCDFLEKRVSPAHSQT